ncbi:MAG: hypothetical protein LBL50_04010 [Candidatus Margulisbacteria bacterium]|jgi:hypothetical protein|nr:hypothetical protein [Candidatus Margulisiibacteriota bacterium]
MADNYTDTTDTDFKGIVGEVIYNIETGKPLSAEGVRNALHTKEKVANKKDTLNDSSTEYPSSKAVYALAQELAAAALPVGMILAMSVSSWTNASAAFKSKWQVCDGTGGTPDLRGRFLRGGTSSDALTGGTNNQEIKLEIKHLPSHTHTQTPHSHALMSYDANGAASCAGLKNSKCYQGVTGANQSGSVHTMAWCWKDYAGHDLVSAETAVNGNTGNNAPYKIEPPAYYTVIYIMKIA